MAKRLREYLVDGPSSLGERSRRRRWTQFVETFSNLADLRVIDLGGTVEFWLRAPVQPRCVVLVNLVSSGVELPTWMSEFVGDACSLPERVTNSSYDLVYSNSVIEHVGGHHRRIAFVEAVHDLAPRHWVQTPYRYFPVEPHWVCPGMQFFPLWLRARIGMRWPLVHTRTDDLGVAIESQLGVELLDLTQMRHYFPGSTIVHDRVAGLTKSIIAVRE